MAQNGNDDDFGFSIPDSGGFTGIEGIDVISPASAAGSGSGGNQNGSASDDNRTTPRRRGRPSVSRNGEGSGTAGNKEKKQAEVLSPDRLAPIIVVAHMMLASKAPEFAITEEKAIIESKAICNYLKHTKVKIDPKTEAFVTMVTVILATEAPMVIMFVKRKRAEAAIAAAQQENSNIVPFQEPFGAGNPYQMPGSR